MRSNLDEATEWRKYMFLDYDPDLFYDFIHEHELEVKHMEHCLPYAVNYDRNMEYVVSKGLSSVLQKARLRNKTDT